MNSGEVFPNADMAYRARRHGQGVAIGDLSVLNEEITKGELVLPIKDMQISDDTEAHHLCCRKDCWTDPRIAAFHKWVSDEATWPCLGGSPLARVLFERSAVPAP
ncbi:MULTISPECIES: LysR substrate-binding domain-containing protein [unclassified Mesorhizobium]|uniref:LysR substrate-binding domain-containing protein n=1 Tax=unclassified Mesorhizobium TaxID=325217 RepID=UPI0033359D43